MSSQERITEALRYYVAPGYLPTVVGVVMSVINQPLPPVPEPPTEPEPPTDWVERLLQRFLPEVPASRTLEEGAHYGLRVENRMETDKTVTDAQHGVYARDAVLVDFYIDNHGGDGVKWEGGDLSMTDCYISGLGLKPEAHADGIQCRGNAGTLRCNRVVFDMPVDAPDGTRSNACVLLQAVNGPINGAEFTECLFYGGNYTMVSSNKNSQYTPPPMEFTRCIFVVEPGVTPRYGLFKLEGPSTFTDCKLYELHNGILVEKDFSE